MEVFHSRNFYGSANKATMKILSFSPSYEICLEQSTFNKELFKYLHLSFITLQATAEIKIVLF